MQTWWLEIEPMKLTKTLFTMESEINTKKIYKLHVLEYSGA